MRQLIKKFLGVVILASGLQGAWAFSLLGPTGNGGDAWQLPIIGYDLAYENDTGIPGGPVFLGDIGGPKNIGEGYRRNVKTLYYAYNANYLGFFGSAGATAADGAFAIMNSLTNVDAYSSGLTEFPLQAQHANYQAMSLYLTDVKSVTLHLLVEQMGLADPERFTWTLAERYLPPGGTCPADEVYLLVKRNFEIAPTPLNQVQYSSYVNNVLYTYYIVETCGPVNPFAFTVPFSTDPLAQQYTAVAANDADTFGGLQIGHYYSGLTRDDVAGLRYLLTSNNIATETAAAGSILTTGVTNFNSSIPFPANTNGAFGGYGTFDLSTLLLAASTNDPVTLMTLFPGLVVASTTTNYIIASGSTVTAYFTNQIGAPIGSPPLLVVVTNYYSYPLAIYTDTFANVVTNHYYATTIGALVTTSFGRRIGAPIGSPLIPQTTTNYFYLTLPNGASLASGDYYLLPTNLCGIDLIQPSIFSTNITTTNFLTSANTNFNGTNLFYNQAVVTHSTQYTYFIHPVTCSEATNATSIYEGVENVKFVRANYDSLIGQFFQPITNTYTMVSITNSRTYLQNFLRIITQPDILLSADNQNAANTFNGTVQRNINFDQGNILPGLAGPGVINAPSTFSYNKLGAAYYNGPSGSTNAFLLNETTQVPSLAWASFDGSTNDPVVYPNGTSIADLENEVLIQITPATLPNGTKNTVYPNTTFVATGGSVSPPFTWSLVSGLGSLPPGLTLSATGTISGTPTQSGTYDFVVQLTDSLARTVQWNYSITIP